MLRFLTLAFVVAAFAVAAPAQTTPGKIRAAKVEGSVSKIVASGAKAVIKEGDMLTQSDTVVTEAGGSVVLVFDNGSSVRVGSDSRLAIEQFTVDPFAEEQKAAELKAEPSRSQTTLNLAYGEMVGDVKKLNKSSTYSIKTPVGAAGIRGTVFRVVFRPSADGKAFFTVQTSEGKVVMTGVTNVEIPVDADKEVVVEIDTNNPSAPNVKTNDLPAETKAAITQIATVIAEVLQTITITPPEPPAPTPPAPPAPTNPDTTPTTPETTPQQGG